MTRVLDVGCCVVTGMGERFRSLEQHLRLTYDGRHAR
jgi:hypothetical protein